MNGGGVVGEAGSTARSFIDALKEQPATLALIVANVAMLVFLFYALSKAADFRESMLKNQFDYQHKVSELLARCIVPERRTQFRRVPIIPRRDDPAKLSPVADPAKPEAKPETKE